MLMRKPGIAGRRVHSTCSVNACVCPAPKLAGVASPASQCISLEKGLCDADHLGAFFRLSLSLDLSLTGAQEKETPTNCQFHAMITTCYVLHQCTTNVLTKFSRIEREAIPGQVAHLCW